MFDGKIFSKQYVVPGTIRKTLQISSRLHEQGESVYMYNMGGSLTKTYYYNRKALRTLMKLFIQVQVQLTWT